MEIKTPINITSFAKQSAIPLQLLLTCIVLFTAFVFCFIRIGFTIDFVEVIKFCGIGLLVANIPMYKSHNFLQWLNFPLFTALFFLCIALSYIVILPFEWLFIVPGLMLFIIHIPAYLRLIFTWSGFVVFFIFVLFSIWFAFLFFGSGYCSPLFLEEIVEGTVHHDQLFHHSISQMIRTYGKASVGLDGVIPVNYHVGSHFLLAKISEIFNSTVAIAYNLISPLIFIPLYFRLLFIASHSFAKSFLDQTIVTNPSEISGRLFYFWFIILHIGLLTYPEKNSFALTQAYAISFSYLAGLVLFYIGLIYLSKANFNNSAKDNTTFLFHLLSVSAIALSGVVKISILMTVLPVWMYIYYRKGWFRQPLILILLISASALGFYEIIAFGGGNTMMFDPLSFLRAYISSGLRMLFYPVYFLTAMIALFFILRRFNIRSFAELKQMIKLKNLLVAEVLILILVISVLPGLCLMIAGGSAGYFSDITRRFAIVLILGVVPTMPAFWMRFGYLSKIFLKTIIAFIVINTFFLFAVNTYRHMIQSIKIKVALRGLSFYGGFLGLQEYYDSNERYVFLKKMQQINDLPSSVKRNSLLYIAQSDSIFYYNWLIQNPGFSSMIIPAVSGVAALDGMPPEDNPPFGDLKLINVYGHYGFTAYKFREKSAGQKDSTVCEKVNARGLKQHDVFILTTQFPDSVLLVNCENSQ